MGEIMKHSKLTPPKAGSIAKRNGGNGGYSKKAEVKAGPMVRRKKNYRDYHGKKVG